MEPPSRRSDAAPEVMGAGKTTWTDREPTTLLTPAEELGLSGMGLAGRVRKAFYAIPEARQLDLFRQLDEEALRRHLVYLRDGRP